METDNRITVILACLRGGIAGIYIQKKLNELDKELGTQDWNDFVKFTNSGLSFFLFYFSFFTFILFYFLVFLFLEYKVRVRSQDTKNEVEGSRINDIIQHGHYMLASCTTHGCLG